MYIFKSYHANRLSILENPFELDEHVKDKGIVKVKYGFYEGCESIKVSEHPSDVKYERIEFTMGQLRVYQEKLKELLMKYPQYSETVGERSKFWLHDPENIAKNSMNHRKLYLKAMSIAVESTDEDIAIIGFKLFKSAIKGKSIDVIREMIAKKGDEEPQEIINASDNKNENELFNAIAHIQDLVVYFDGAYVLNQPQADGGRFKNTNIVLCEFPKAIKDRAEYFGQFLETEDGKRIKGILNQFMDYDIKAEKIDRRRKPKTDDVND